MEGIRSSPELTLQLVVTGSHLAEHFGSTHLEIEADGLTIDRRVDIALDSDLAPAIARSMGIGLSEFGKAFSELKPDLLLVLGDRYEILAAVAAATISRIPIAHVHGGEITEGAFDEGIRHAITKLSHLHFVAAEEYRRRVIQLGEQPDRVFLVGGLGIDSVLRLPLIDRATLEESLGISLGPRSLLVTFHPATLEPSMAARQVEELLAALHGLENTTIIFTMPNADPEGRSLFDLINDFVAHHPNSRAFASLGQQRYLSCVQHTDGVVGNSSSGLIEVPAFRKGTVNIGDRQKGRLKAASVLDCLPERASIAEAIDRLYSPQFQATLEYVVNPYGQGGASDRIVATLRQQRFEGLLKKSFYDLPS